MIYGGYTGSSRVDKIYKYNKDGGQWDKMSNKMGEKKSSMTAINVEKSIFNSC